MVLVVALVAIFNANFRAINSRDTTVNEYAALAMAATGSADLDRFPRLVEAGVARGYIQVVNGQARSSYPLLPPLVAAPAYRIAIDLGLIDPRAPQSERVEAVGAFVASVCVAIACACLYLTLVYWRPDAPAFAIALACGLATPLWSSASRALWSHAPAALLLGAGLFSVLARPPGAPRRERVLFTAGMLIALAVTSRLLLVVFPVGIAIGLWRAREPGRHVVAFSAGVAAASLVALGLNRFVYDAWLGGQTHLYSAGVNLDTHGVSSAWNGAWLSGLAGLLVSPSRGMLIYMPVVLVAAAGAYRAWRDGGVPRYGLVAAIACYVALWATYSVWWGGQSYGPRFAADIAIPLALVSAYALAGWPQVRVGLRVGVLAVLVWSVGIQAIGAVDYPAGNWDAFPRDVDRAHERLWDWRDSQIVRTVRAGTYWQYKATRARAATVVVAGGETSSRLPSNGNSGCAQSQAASQSLAATAPLPPGARRDPASESCP